MKNMTLNQKLGSLMAVLWLGLLAIGVFGAWQNRVSMVDDRREELRALVSEGYTATAHFASLAADKTITEDEAKKQALATIKSLRYGTDGYLSVNDSHAVMLMHPIKPEMDGKDMSGFPDPAGNKDFVNILPGV